MNQDFLIQDIENIKSQLNFIREKNKNLILDKWEFQK